MFSLRLGERWEHASGDNRAAVCLAAGQRGANPWTDAVDRLQVVLVPEVVEEQRWPGWREAVTASRFRSAVVLPASIGPTADLALTLYSQDRDPWDGVTLVAADQLAQLAARALAVQINGDRLAGAAADQHRAASSFVTVQQAVGITMVRDGCDAAEALAVLQQAAVRSGRTAEDVAAEVVARARADAEAMPPAFGRLRTPPEVPPG